MDRIVTAAVALVCAGAVWAAPAAALDAAAAADRLEAAHARVEAGEDAAARRALAALRADAEAAGSELAARPRGDLLAAVHGELAGLAWRRGDDRAAAGHLRASLDAYGPERLKDRPVTYILHELTLATAWARAGDVERAEAPYGRAEAHFDVLFSGRVNTQLAFSLVFKRDMTRAYLDLRGHPPARAVAGAEEAIDLAERMGAPYETMHHFARAFALARDGRLEAAAEAADAAAAGGLPFGEDYVSRAMLFRAGALGALGRREEARTVARAAERYADSNAAQVVLLQLLEALEGPADGAWPVRFDPRAERFLLAIRPRVELTSEVVPRGDARVPRPVVNVAYAVDIVSAE